MSGDVIEIKVGRSIGARPDEVFEAWFDPAVASKFLFATADGEIVRCDIDAEAGGEFCIVDRRDGEDIEHMGEWVEITRPLGTQAGRIVFDFSVNQSPAARVAVEIAANGNASQVTLTHFMDAKWAAHADRARQGWAMILDRLAQAAE